MNPLHHSTSRDSLKDPGKQIKEGKENDDEWNHSRGNGLDLDTSSTVGLGEGCRRTVGNFQKVTEGLPSLFDRVFQQFIGRDQFSDFAIVFFVRLNRVLLFLIDFGNGGSDEGVVLVDNRKEPSEVDRVALDARQENTSQVGWRRDGLGHAFPRAEPHLTVLSSRQNELAVGVLVHDLLVVESNGKVHRGLVAVLCDNVKVRLSQDGVALIERGLEDQVRPHFENVFILILVQVLGVKSGHAQFLQGQLDRVLTGMKARNMGRKK